MGICSAKENRKAHESVPSGSVGTNIKSKSPRDRVTFVDKSSSRSKDGLTTPLSTSKHAGQSQIESDSDGMGTEDDCLPPKPPLQMHGTKVRHSHKFGSTPSPSPHYKVPGNLRETKHRASSKLLPARSRSVSQSVTPKSKSVEPRDAGNRQTANDNTKSNDSNDAQLLHDAEMALLEHSQQTQVSSTPIPDTSVYAGLQTPRVDPLSAVSGASSITGDGITDGTTSPIAVYPHDFEDRNHLMAPPPSNGQHRNMISFDSNATYAKKEQLPTPSEFAKFSTTSTGVHSPVEIGSVSGLDSSGNVLLDTIYANQRDRNLSMTGQATPGRKDSDHLIPHFPSRGASSASTSQSGGGAADSTEFARLVAIRGESGYFSGDPLNPDTIPWAFSQETIDVTSDIPSIQSLQ